ncbi:MAG: sigma-70 family RNA polymerase sigma factor [Oscillospiraceae bacterium]|nr:sigma-70 family RNA polymerase sigma factor [Oscillospiraceae bacterium]
MNDKQLVKLLRSNPAEGLGEIINTYSGLLTAVVMRILKNPQEAEECVADVFIGLWKNSENIKKSESLKGYLLCIARNNAVNRYHKLKKQSGISIENTENFEIIADDDVELLVIKKEFMGELQKLILKMPEPNKEIFMRKYFLFEPVRDIAEKLNLSEVQVKDRLYRSRKQIQKNFKERGITFDEVIYSSN